MSRSFNHDSRSPTIRQTPPRRTAIPSVEGSGHKIEYLLDALRHQISEDRKEQDELAKKWKKIKNIHKKQDEYLSQIADILKAANDNIDDQENTSQESQTQEMAYPLPEADVDRGDAVSDAGDSVIVPTQQYDTVEDAGSRDTPTRTHSLSPVRSAVELANTQHLNNQARGTTEIAADFMLGMMGREDDEAPATSLATETMPAPPTPTPVSPSLRRVTVLKTAKRTPSTAEKTAARQTDPASSGSVYEPSTPIPAGPSRMQPPPRTSTGRKRKRGASIDSSFSEGQSIRSYFPPTTASEPRPRRQAKALSEEKTRNFMNFQHLRPREQSVAFTDRDKNPFYFCGDCRKRTCQTCLNKGIATSVSTPRSK